jgi:hypothetical protein
MVLNFNLITFDIVSDLSFGESFGGLMTRTMHPWITAFFELAMMRAIFVQIINLKIPVLSSVARNIFLPRARKRVGAMDYTRAQVEKRLGQGTDRADFMSYVLRHNDERGMSRAEIQETFNLLMLAGSETTATLLAGCTFLLQKHPRVCEKLEAEIRGNFSTNNEITMFSVSHLKYLDAVVEESLRLYPPVPIALNRTTPPQGATICGNWVPGNVCTLLSYIWHMSPYSRSSRQMWVSRNLRPTPPPSTSPKRPHSYLSACSLTTTLNLTKIEGRSCNRSLPDLETALARSEY